MRRGGFTLLDGVAVVAIVAVFAVILFPVVLRPRLWSQTTMPPMSFHNAELKSVVGRLHQKLYQQRKMDFLKEVEWESEGLKHRKVTLVTTKEMTIRQLIALVESNSNVRFKGMGSCGTCGYPIGHIAIVDRPQVSKQAQ